MSNAVAQGGCPKTQYRTRNWREYDRGLISRGDLTVRILSDLAWHAAEGTGRRGRPQVFTDAAIQTVLTLKVLYQPAPATSRPGHGDEPDPAGWVGLADAP